MNGKLLRLMFINDPVYLFIHLFKYNSALLGERIMNVFGNFVLF